MEKFRLRLLQKFAKMQKLYILKDLFTFCKQNVPNATLEFSTDIPIKHLYGR